MPMTTPQQRAGGCTLLQNTQGDLLNVPSHSINTGTASLSSRTSLLLRTPHLDPVQNGVTGTVICAIHPSCTLLLKQEDLGAWTLRTLKLTRVQYEMRERRDVFRRVLSNYVRARLP